MSAAPIVAMRGIVKHFGRVVALDGVDLTVMPGEVHAVVGENGAGKSTLMHILSGMVQPDAGRIEVRGGEVNIATVEDAYALRIAMVHQHFMLFPSLTVAENLTIGREPRGRGGFFDQVAAERAVLELGERYGLKVDPRAQVSTLSVGDLQRVEILRALFRGAEILILDEPTAVLTPQEAAGLFRVIRDLASEGKTTIFISHKLEELLEISETITVLRDGHLTGVRRTKETDAHELARLMVGREVFLQFDRPPIECGDPVLELAGVSGPGINNISFSLRAGEIVGIAGVAGNGQTELADVIAGLSRATAGSIKIEGRDVTHASVAERRNAGLANIPEDRYKRGLAPDATLADNMVMGVQDRPPASERGILNWRAIVERARRLIARFQVKADSPARTARTLSGGNAQKVVVARELAEDKPLILAAQPTRGIDIAASEFVRGELLRRRNAHAGVLLISADLSEVLSLADRVLVMYAGEIVGEVSSREADETRLGLLMAGVKDGKGGSAPAVRQVAEPAGGSR